MTDMQITEVVEDATQVILQGGSDVEFLMECMGLSEYMGDYTADDEVDDDGNPDVDPCGWKEIQCAFFMEYFYADLEKIHKELLEWLEGMAGDETLTPLQAFRVVVAYDMLKYGENGVISLKNPGKKVQFAQFLWDQGWMDRYDEETLKEVCENLKLIS